MKLLFAEDDPDLAAAVKTLLERNGYLVDAVDNGEDAVSYAEAESYDGMILDWMMPEKDGIRALQEMRKKGIRTPCMMLTARDAVEDRVAGLDAGADDYLPKPFATAELLARIRAMLRRKADYKPDLLKFGDLTLDRQEMSLSRSGKTVKLSNKMYQLMEMMIEQPGRVFEVNQLIERIWGWDCESDSNVIWVTVFNLRKILKDLGTTVTIKATRGVGYSLEGGK
jgi:DNA-binding response OmpR family regulator